MSTTSRTGSSGATAPSRRSRRTLWAGVGGVTAAFLGSLCCLGPLLFVTLGVGAGLASTFEPLRPVFAVIMLALFGLAFYSVYGSSWRTRSLANVTSQANVTAHANVTGPAADGVGAPEAACATAACATAACATGEACPAPRDRRREQVILWVAVVLALVLWTFPTWSQLLV